MHLSHLQHLTQNYIQEKSMYLSISKKVVWIHLQSLHTSSSLPYTTQHFDRSSHPDVILEKGFLKMCSKFTGEHPCRSVISIKFLFQFIDIALWHEHSPVNLLCIFRKPFLKNISGWLLLQFLKVVLKHYYKNFVFVLAATLLEQKIF